MKARDLIATAALTLAAGWLQPASAQTLSYADAYDQIAKACQSDIQRHCAGVSLGSNGITSCLAGKPGVSGQCKSVVANSIGQLAKRAAAQDSTLKVCDTDTRRLCQGVQPRDGYRLSCLLKATGVVSATCNQTITDAGWR